MGHLGSRQRAEGNRSPSRPGGVAGRPWRAIQSSPGSYTARRDRPASPSTASDATVPAAGAPAFHAADALQAVRAGRSLDRRAGAMPGRCAAGDAGAVVSRAALARQRAGAARAAGAATAAAAGRRAADLCARAAVAGRAATVRRAHARRPGGARGRACAAAAATAPRSSTPCCAASCANARRLSAALADDPVARWNHPRGGSTACAQRLARPVAGAARRRQRAPADDAARQRAAR